MESVVALKAEWISLGEMIKQQEQSTLISDILREWQDKETMESLGDQIWNEMNEEWAEYMHGEGNSPALYKWRLGTLEKTLREKNLAAQGEKMNGRNRPRDVTCVTKATQCSIQCVFEE